MMEIKTDGEIALGYGVGFTKEQKWVAVDDLFKEIEIGLSSWSEAYKVLSKLHQKLISKSALAESTKEVK